MEALLKAAAAPDYPAHPVLVVSNRPDAAGLETAKAAGIMAQCVDHRTFGKDRQSFEAEIDRILTEAGVQVIALAGFMRVLTPWFVSRWQGRMVNIHPSLLPRHKGLNTHQRALDAGDEIAGCTVHWVSAGVDEGDIIAQARIPVLPGDTADSLAARLLPEEHRLYPEALALACRTIASTLQDFSEERPQR